MNHDITIAMLLRSRRKEPFGPEEWRRVKARCAWAREMVDKWYQAQLRMNARCDAMVDKLSEEEFERFADAEEAKVQAIRAQIDAALEHDRWPAHLHWGGI